MEDLRKTGGFKMTNRRDSLDIDHMRLVAEILAKIHSLSWAYRQKVEKNILEKFSCFTPNFDEEDRISWTSMLVTNLSQSKRIFDKVLGNGNVLSKATEKFEEYYKDIVLDVFMGNQDAKDFEEFLKVRPIPERFGKDAENPGIKLILLLLIFRKTYITFLLSNIRAVACNFPF